ncbi:hypothetical protein JXA12_05715 [Candidatus Woesearchaeota archaeon]|nr:hypothetical protein [Candidatus Woesearchaeota archaeon]
MRRVVGFSFIGLSLLLVFVGGWWLQHEGSLSFSGFPFTGEAPGLAFLCINTPPDINFSCADSFNQSTSIEDNGLSCAVNGSDADGESVSLGVELDEGMGWAYVQNGRLYLRPFQDQVGNHSINLTATDGSQCSNNLTKFRYDFSVLDVNDPPYLVEDVPDDEFSSGSSSSPYSLYSYFDDPDGDSLSFSVIGAGLVNVTISQVTGNVFYTSDGCGEDYMYFRAVDPGNLSADSNIVEVEVLCEDPDGSGGGIGGSTSSFTCTPKWKCGEWSDCFVNGTRYRECYDLNGCDYDDYHRVFWEECEYVPTCHDGIQNNGEEGVDCGGPCPPCGTCHDGIQNNDEEGVDCGGTYCEPCFNCTDGIQNWGETGVDCGGPVCDPCPSCFDGVQNQNETGVDCGGPCPPCIIPEMPGVVEKPSPLTNLLLMLLGVLITLLVVFKFYHHQLYAAVARLGWYFTRKRRKQVLLSDEHKRELLRRLASIGRVLAEGNPSTAAVMERLAGLSRSFFMYAFSLPFAFTADDLEVSMKASLNHESLRRVLRSFFAKTARLERVDARYSLLECSVFVEELRQLVFQTSVVVGEDLTEEASELALSGSPLERCWQSLYNVFLALQFEEVDAAKGHYLKLLSSYELLGERQKGLVAADVARCFHEVRYLLSWHRR